uniref:B-cell translocation protein 2, btg2 n=1 Tax=Scolopendra viridis TaxID=118503 RepID=A0A4D5R982_SCOVI
MRFEINSAATFLMNLLRMSNSLNEQQLEIFRTKLEDLLKKHYQHHWFPEQPCKGSGYRCLRINHKMDPLIAKAAEASGVSDSSLLQNMFPNELTLWIDPREVSYRIGENGSICVLFDASSLHNNNNNNNERYSRCKEVVRGLDNMIMDPRNMSFEQFTAYVSS